MQKRFLFIIFFSLGNYVQGMDPIQKEHPPAFQDQLEIIKDKLSKMQLTVTEVKQVADRTKTSAEQRGLLKNFVTEHRESLEEPFIEICAKGVSSMFPGVDLPDLSVSISEAENSLAAGYLLEFFSMKSEYKLRLLSFIVAIEEKKTWSKETQALALQCLQEAEEKGFLSQKKARKIRTRLIATHVTQL